MLYFVGQGKRELNDPHVGEKEEQEEEEEPGALAEIFRNRDSQIKLVSRL